MRCVSCKRELSEEEFSINPKTGEYYKHCNSCREKDKEYREQNKDKLKEYDKEYREQNKDKIKEKKKKYKEQNKDKLKEYQKEYSKEYREQNKDKIKERMKEYYEQNKDKLKEKYKEYREQNKDKIKEYREKNKDRINERKKEYNKSNVLYETYKDKLIGIDYKSDEEGYLLVRCKYCNKWFHPTNLSVKNFIKAGDGTNNLYCSDGCKKSCPTYGMRKYEKGYRQNTSREVQPELRKLVLERDNWTCQKCGRNKDEDINLILHCHHIDPVKNNPIESADIDNCVTLCKECHKEAHRRKGCRYIDLANCSN